MLHIFLFFSLSLIYSLTPLYEHYPSYKIINRLAQMKLKNSLKNKHPFVLFKIHIFFGWNDENADNTSFVKRKKKIPWMTQTTNISYFQFVHFKSIKYSFTLYLASENVTFFLLTYCTNNKKIYSYFSEIFPYFQREQLHKLYFGHVFWQLIVQRQS